MTIGFCARCRARLTPETATPRKGRDAGPWCRSCKQQYDRDYYASTRERRLARKVINDARRMARNRLQAWNWLRTHPCVDCGESDPIVLEFDHRDGTEKDMAVSDLIGGGASLERLQREIDKCDVRCANCHRRRTAMQLGWFDGT